MLKLSELKEGNWVVLRNGKRKKVVNSKLALSYTPDYGVYNVTFERTEWPVRYDNDGALYGESGGIPLAPEDIVSVWDHKPKRYEIMEMIKKGSIVNIRGGRSKKVKNICIEPSIYPYYLTFYDEKPTGYNIKGQFLDKECGLLDIVSVESSVSNKVEGLLM